MNTPLLIEPNPFQKIHNLIGNREYWLKLNNDLQKGIYNLKLENVEPLKTIVLNSLKGSFIDRNHLYLDDRDTFLLGESIRQFLNNKDHELYPHVVYFPDTPWTVQLAYVPKRPLVVGNGLITEFHRILSDFEIIVNVIKKVRADPRVIPQLRPSADYIELWKRHENNWAIILLVIFWQSVEWHSCYPEPQDEYAEDRISVLEELQELTEETYRNVFINIVFFERMRLLMHNEYENADKLLSHLGIDLSELPEKEDALRGMDIFEYRILNWAYNFTLVHDDLEPIPQHLLSDMAEPFPMSFYNQ